MTTPLSAPEKGSPARVRVSGDGRTYGITAASYSASLDVRALLLSVRSGPLSYEFKLAGAVRAHPAGRHEGPYEVDGPAGEASCEADGASLRLRFGLGGALGTKTAVLTFKDNHFTYRLGLTADRDLDVWDVTYGVSGDSPSRCAFDEFFLWCPDRYQSRLPRRQDVELKLSTTRMPDDGFFRGDIGKYLVPPYIAALHQGGHWAGFATMEVPSSQLGLHMIVNLEAYRLNFRFSHNTRASAKTECLLPEIGFYFNAERDGVLRDYVESLYTGGLATRPSTWADWWAEPIYCNYADQVYSHTLESGIMKDEAGSLENCSQAFIDARLATFERHAIPWGTLIVDFGWMDFLGDYRPRTDRFPDMRAYIDGLHRKGKRVLLWFAPFFCESESRMAREHPDWFLKNRDGSVCEHLWMKRRIFTPDFTNPAVRSHLTRVIGFLLGDAKGCLNADGFKIDGYSFLPDVDHGFHEPAWGVGDRFQHRADRLVYEEAKKVKADALVENSFANPFLNDTQDLCRLNDASSYDTDLYENRAWVAWLCGVAVPDTDDWSAFKKMFVHSTLRKSVYGVPALYAIDHRGAGRMGGASGGYPVGIPEKDYRKVSAILRCYAHSPMRPDQERFVDPEMKVFWRKFGSGPLKGSLAAAGLAGNTAIAAYDEHTVMLAAITETRVVVPIPDGYEAGDIRELGPAGESREPHHLSAGGGDVLLSMQPSCGAVDHYEIDLVKKRP